MTPNHQQADKQRIAELEAELAIATKMAETMSSQIGRYQVTIANLESQLAIARDLGRLRTINRIASGEDQFFRGKQIRNKTEALGIIWVESSFLISALSSAPDQLSAVQEKP